MVKTLSVTIIGLGNIGMLYDYYKTDSKIRLSHLKSFYYNPKFKVINCIDLSQEKLDLAKKIYGDKINYYKTFTPKIKETDIYVLCSQPKTNRKYFHEILNNNNNCFFLVEKPGWKISADYNLSHINEKVYFNYFRKAIPSFQKLKRNIENNTFGQIQSVICYYTKGLKNNGSHLIDLIFYFFGEKVKIETLNVTKSIVDYDKNDETLSFSLKIEYKKNDILVNFIGLDEKMYSIIEMDIMAEFSRISIKDFGGRIIYEEVGEDKLFNGYKKHTKKRFTNSNLSLYGNFVTNHIYKIYFNKMKNDSGLNNEKNISGLIELIKNF